MTKVFALIREGRVVNCVLWDGISPWAPEKEYTAVDITAVNPRPAPGWTYLGGIFRPPVQVEVPSISTEEELEPLEEEFGGTVE